MAEHYSLTEVSKITGLAPHTLRYYEQQFPEQLQLERTRGGHRIYNAQHLEALQTIIYLLKTQRLPIKKAQEILSSAKTSNINKVEKPQEVKRDEHKSSEKHEICSLLSTVIEKLDLICRNDENRDKMLMGLLMARSKNQNSELIQQIARCRKETHETVKLCQTIIRQGFRIN